MPDLAGAPLRQRRRAASPRLFGDVARYFENWAETAPHDELDAFLAVIERLAATKGYEENLISVSFIEYFAWGDARQQDILARLWSRFGPATQRAGSLTWDDNELERRTALERTRREGVQ